MRASFSAPVSREAVLTENTAVVSSGAVDVLVEEAGARIRPHPIRAVSATFQTMSSRVVFRFMVGSTARPLPFRGRGAQS